MKRRLYIAAGLIGVVVFTTIVWGYWEISPQQHFRNISHPVIASPHMQMPSIDSPDHELGQTQVLNLEDRADKPPPRSEPNGFNLLLLGIDAHDGGYARSDVVMAAHVDLKNNSISVLSVPRDTQVNIAGVGQTKINHAHLLGSIDGGNGGGTQASIQAVSNLLQAPIHYYAKVNFDGFVHLVDTIGGVEVDLPAAVTLDARYADRTETTVLPAGRQRLDGATALSFVRERYSLPHSDFDRQSNQMMVLKSIARRMTRLQSLLELPDLLKRVKTDLLDTNLKDSDIVSLAWFYHQLEDDQVSYEQLPGRSEYAQDPLIRSRLYYWIPDQDELERLSKMFQGYE